MNMNKNTLANFREDFKVSATLLEEQYGLSISLGSIRYAPDGSNFTCKLSATNVGEIAVGESVEQAEFKVNAPKFGFEASDYNRATWIYGEAHQLIGFNTNARKNTCLIKNGRGTTYVTDAYTCKQGFKGN